MEGQEEVKSTAPESMKFRRLQRRLGTSKCQTVGMLELLWIATAAIYHAGIQGIEPTFIWESANIGEAIKPGLISEIATKIRAREIKKPRPYIEKALRTECESLGLNPSLVRTKVPPYEKLAHA